MICTMGGVDGILLTMFDAMPWKRDDDTHWALLYDDMHSLVGLRNPLC